MLTLKNDNAVSPVVGVILLVAITVIMAAIIAAFIFGYGTTLHRQRFVGLSANQINGTHIIVTYSGGADSSDVDCVTFRLNDEERTLSTDKICNCNGAYEPNCIGDSVSLSNATTGKDHLVGIGLFLDGSTYTVMDTYL